MNPLRRFSAALGLFLAVHVVAADFSVQRADVLALGQLTSPPAMESAEGMAGTPELRSIFYEAKPWKGKPTKVFAWLGLPARREGKVPGIVLVHGGGGTAYREWVQKWNAHGFAAISIAVEGQTDERVPNPLPGAPWKRHAFGGPAREGIYGDMAQPLADQWMYHAVADTVLANSLLRSLPEVDASRVGLCGISWGGVITSTVVGIDPRFAFAIPIYGCGHLFDAGNQYGRALGGSAAYREVWDPVLRLERARMPMLWLSWPEDLHFPLDCQAASYRAALGPRMVALLPGMKHSHLAGWNPPDSYAFAESIVRAGQPWCAQTGQRVDGSRVEITFASAKPLDRALLISTTETGFTGNRKWVESPAQLTKDGGAWRIAATLPVGTTAWFVNARSGPLTVSSDFQETTPAR